MLALAIMKPGLPRRFSRRFSINFILYPEFSAISGLYQYFSSLKLLVNPLFLTLFLFPYLAIAKGIENPITMLYGIDKITGRITKFSIPINETVRFGQLRITPRVCYSRPISEPPKTTVFLEIDEITFDNQIRRVFTGWMVAESPSLNALEHPINDVWLVSCK
ncbi:DUF2155 domain-containing protein [Candidatus Endowatersipora endosymbiont of Watersipora subatra]|uniref:DUF2155 domain-containing protein n=1 Tax=Candidatus Endowatersipora endosymbiont of Watersipora subatra TaxID=3077946 RepID=UPI00312CA384